MNNFDGPRANEMDSFLQYLNRMKTFTGYIDHDLVYSALCCCYLKPEEKLKNAQGQEVLSGVSVMKYFPMWTERFQRRNNVTSFVDPGWKNFCQFVSQRDVPRGPYIKLYIPLDQEHLYNGANMIFDFIDKNNIKTQSKIGHKMRVDNVIVRLNANDVESARKIIDYVNRTPYLRDGMNRVNPFIPTINGVGYMKERGNSYNSDLTDYIVEYINKNRNRNVSAADFKSYLEQCKRENHVLNPHIDSFDDSLLEVFNNAYYGKSADLSVLNTVEQKKSNEDVNALIKEAIKETYYKYGIGQVQTALERAAVFSDYSYITNGGSKHLRDRMERSVTPQDIVRFINMETKMVKGSIKAKIIELCAKMFAFDPTVILDEASKCTIENHNERQCAGAIRRYVNSGDPTAFSRYRGEDRSINHRVNVQKINREYMQSVMLRSLANRSITFDPKVTPDLADFYSQIVAQELLTLGR